MDHKDTLINKIERYSALLTILLLTTRILIGTELNVILRISLTILSIFYMWFGFFIFNRLQIMDLLDRRKRGMLNIFKVAGSILMGLCYSYCLTAIIFSLYFFKGMHFMLGLSTFLLVLGTAAIGIYHWFNPGEFSYLKQYYQRSAVIGLFAVILLATPLETRLKVLYRDHPDFVEAYMAYHNDPSQEQVVETLREVRSRFR